MDTTIAFAKIFAQIFSFEVAIILLLTIMPRLGGAGKDLSQSLTKAPWLDLILSLILWIPWLIAGLMGGWLGFGAALLAQMLAMESWAFVHELIHRNENSRSCIYPFHNQRLGWWRNNLALWVTAIVIPVFFAIRLVEIICYQPLVWLLKFPNYNHSEWVNVTRNKFQGLIGHDLIWCLYCDWMTGVYSLGAEMLRNVESFWCPIRFYDGKKCDNCKIDFPDIENGWVAADGTIDDVEGVLQRMYGGNHRSWFGHRERQNDK